MAPRVLTGMAGALGICLLVGQAAAQTLTLSPPCGKRGDTVVAVLGSGWPEPAPPCEYLFLFDGQEIAPRQPDGINGPPSASFQVPMNASIGMHTVKVELRLQDDGSLVKWCQLPFKVVDQNGNPWKIDPVAPGEIEITFDAKESCDNPQCENIFLIQSVRTTGSGPSQPPRPITPSEVHMPSSSSLDAEQDAAGNAIDEMADSGDPYQNGRDSGGGNSGAGGGPETGMGTNTSQLQLPSTFTDEPRILDQDFPPGIDTITMDFEVNVYCESGAAAGQWLGRYTWSWTRTKGSPGPGAGQITPGTGSRQPPSAAFQQALNRWQSFHPWKKSKPSPSRGATCGP
jgi:hypothetical protein